MKQQAAIFTGIAILGFICASSSITLATTIPITSGSIQDGFFISSGDFDMEGPNLSLFQSTPDGSDLSGAVSCAVGAVCNLSVSIGVFNRLCTLCSDETGGMVGNKTAELLSGSLTISGSAFYSGGDTLKMPVNITGTIVGYELINCGANGDPACSLGPVEFRLRISAHGIDTLFFVSGDPIGMLSTVNGFATVAPEPTSLLLTGSGLIAIWIRRRRAAMRFQLPLESGREP
jgi:hypothetical protein